MMRFDGHFPSVPFTAVTHHLHSRKKQCTMIPPGNLTQNQVLNWQVIELQAHTDSKNNQIGQFFRICEIELVANRAAAPVYITFDVTYIS